jgi:hypothetical protein
MKQGGVNTSKTTEYKTPEALAKMVMQESMRKFGGLTNEQYSAMVKDAEQVLNQFSNAKSNSIATGGETEFGEIFYIHEGMFNNEYGDLVTQSEDVEYVENTYTVDIHTDQNGNYYIYNTDLSVFYSDLAVTAGLETDPANNELMILCDLNVVSMDDVNGTAIIRAGMSIGIPIPTPPQYLNPGPMMAAEQLSSCPGTVGAGEDAADFIRAYLMSFANDSYGKMADHCATLNNKGVNTVIVDYWGSDNMIQNPAPTFMTDVYPYFWKGESNNCLGNTNSEWATLYAESEILRDVGLGYIYNQYPYLGSLEMVHTDYKSKKNTLLAPAHNMIYNHGGLFSYGKYMCVE